MEKLIVTSIVAPIYKNPDFRSELITQAFIWEKLRVLDQKENWLRVKQWDDYEGWIHNNYLVESPDVGGIDYIQITNDIVDVCEMPNIFSGIVGKAPFASELPLIDKNLVNGRWLNVLLPNDQLGWITNQHPITGSFSRRLYSSALRLLHSPYLWGGKTALGFDCSGLIQTIFKSQNIPLPRDVIDQVAVEELQPITEKALQTGDLIFFGEGEDPTHVGMGMGSADFIHASGSVKLASLDEESKFFDAKLANQVITCMSTSIFSSF